MKRHIIMGLILIGLVQHAKPQVRLSHTTPVDEIPVEETATLAGLTTQLGYVCEGCYGLDFPGLIELVKRLHAPRWMFRKAVKHIWSEISKRISEKDTSNEEMRRCLIRQLNGIQLLTLCADQSDRALFKTMCLDDKLNEQVREWAFFAWIFSASDEDLSSALLDVPVCRECFTVSLRLKLYKQIALAYSLASLERKTRFAEPFHLIVRQETDIRAWFHCDELMKVFDPGYAKSDERLRDIHRFLSLPDLGDGHKNYWLSGIDSALDECTNHNVTVKRLLFVPIDAYPPFVSYEESILGEKPNPYRTAIRIAAGSVCVIGLFAGMWVWMRRKRMGRSDPFPHFE